MAAFHALAGPRDAALWQRFEANEKVRTKASWRVRLRYWLNSFRGFAAFDIRGVDPR
ncbi:MAG TPA: hypothetical protein VJN63_09445 [Thermoplasmata archaeon]|nr:hypothetical protein [Thermoplasmata archaeon]